MESLPFGLEVHYKTGFPAVAHCLWCTPLLGLVNQQRTNFALHTLMSNTTTIPFAGLDMSVTFGPLYWGYLLSLLLAGINIVQAYLYFTTSERHEPRIKLVALLMLLLNFTSSSLVAQSIYYYLIPHFGSLGPLNSITNELSAECLISTLMTFISQMLFPLQLHEMSKQRKGTVAACAVAATAVLTFLFGIACSTVMIIHPHAVLGSRGDLFKLFFGLAKGFGALTDVMATTAMCLLLTTSRTGFGRTDTLINTLIQYFAQRGLMVTLIQIVIMIIFFAAPKNLYWFSFHVNMTKLYANTFFSITYSYCQLYRLNGREDIYRERFCNNGIHDVQILSTSSGFASRSFISKIRGHSNSLNRPDYSSRMQELDISEPSSPVSLRGERSYSGPAMPIVTKTVIVSDL